MSLLHPRQSPPAGGGYFGSEGVRSIKGPVLEAVANTWAASTGFFLPMSKLELEIAVRLKKISE